MLKGGPLPRIYSDSANAVAVRRVQQSCALKSDCTGALVGTARKGIKIDTMEKQSLPPHFPNHPQACAFLKVLDDTRLGLYRSMDPELGQQIGSPERYTVELEW